MHVRIKTQVRLDVCSSYSVMYSANAIDISVSATCSFERLLVARTAHEAVARRRSPRSFTKLLAD